VIGAARIKQWMPVLQSQLHGAEEPYAPWVRKGKTILGIAKLTWT